MKSLAFCRRALGLFAPFVLAVTAHAAAPAAVSFIAMGDWGREGKDHQTEVAVQMGITGAEIDSQFVLALGDNFYDNGVQSVDDPQWKTSFENIYTAPVLQRPWQVVIGNHDYRTNVQAQIDYTKLSKRWRLPARNYSFIVKVDEKTTAEFFVIDSSPFVAAYRAELKYKGVIRSRASNSSGSPPGSRNQPPSGNSSAPIIRSIRAAENTATPLNSSSRSRRSSRNTACKPTSTVTSTTCSTSGSAR